MSYSSLEDIKCCISFLKSSHQHICQMWKILKTEYHGKKDCPMSRFPVNSVTGIHIYTLSTICPLRWLTFPSLSWTAIGWTTWNSPNKSFLIRADRLGLLSLSKVIQLCHWSLSFCDKLFYICCHICFLFIVPFSFLNQLNSSKVVFSLYISSKKPRQRLPKS